MRIKSNYHTHSTYCDGMNTLREMVDAALEKGFNAIGFSGHSYTPFDEEVSMSVEDTGKYEAELDSLKAEYADKIKILAGIEQDYFSEMTRSNYDYVIGSVHYTYKDGKYLSVDETPELFEMAVRDYYGNDVYGFIEDYYRLVADVVRKTDADIIGHLDLITKFNEGEKYFSENHPRYVAAVDEAIKKLIATGKLFEINTGAMARGYRKEPYPSSVIIKKIAEAGGRFILSSDAHSKENLDYGFEQVLEYLEDIGVDKDSIVTDFK